jgi:large subunit ribosomal protein L9
MKIILTAAVANLGKVGDVVEVKNGYAKNFLVPNKKAICFTANNSKIFESKRKEFEQENQKDLEVAAKVQEQLIGKDISIIENASDDGRLYGSVSSTVIANKINDLVKQKVASRVNVFLKKPIKEIGVYVAKLVLHSEVSIDVKLIVARTESEVASLIKADKKASEKEEVKVEAKSEAKVEEASEGETSEAAAEKPKKEKKKKAKAE